jgi:hypothetical protein
MRDFLEELLTGSPKVIGQKVDKELRWALCSSEQKVVLFIYRT